MTTKELYDLLVSKPELHSLPKLYEDILVWNLYPNAHIQAYCDDTETRIDLMGGADRYGLFYRWRLTESEMLPQLYDLGKKGNLLVLKRTLQGTQVFYLGLLQNFPLPQKPSLHLGAKKWDAGQLLYFEQK